ncbi:MAG TPA: hypothetical protein VFE09_07225, partial [Rubrobacteraceae bacterium]|nr:hypothetical protein [Rubrobacteraceae bacterium]
MLVLEDLPPSLEDSAGQLFHTQQERLLPTPSSTPVTVAMPSKSEATVLTSAPIRIERRLRGDREENQPKAARNRPAKLFRRSGLPGGESVSGTL